MSLPTDHEYEYGAIISTGSSVPTSTEQSLNGTDGLDVASSGTRTTVGDDGDPDTPVGPRSIRNICCVGAGYVGGPTAAVIAFKNPQIRVTVADKDERRIRRWNSRHLPIYEPGLTEIVRIVRDGVRIHPTPPVSTQSEGNPRILNEHEAHKAQNREEGSTASSRIPNLFFSANVSKCIRESDIVIIAVNTPTKMRGSGAGSATDMTAFEAVAADVVQHARNGSIIVEKSTVPCKTAQMIQEIIAVRRPGEHFEILSNPEFLAAGTAIQDLLHPDRVIIGSATTEEGKTAAETLAGVYSGWVDQSRIITTNIWSSELAKLVANSMLAQRLSSINSISALCEATGAEINEISASIGMDSRVGDKFLRAGIGFGGSCFKKDVLSLVYLAESLGLKEVGAYWRQVVTMNEYQRNRFTSRVIKCLNNTLVGKKITLLGYAFKKNTSDTREAPALEIIKTLLDENPGEIAIFDPCCNPYVIETEIRQLHEYGPPALRDDGGAVKVYSDVYEACASSNAVLIVTEFDEFRNTELVAVPHSSNPPSGHLPLNQDMHQSPRIEAIPVTNSVIDPLYVAYDQENLEIEPNCAVDCPDCQRESGSEVAVRKLSNNLPKKQVDWERIGNNMKTPKWLFDGRCIIEIKKMTQLGIRVESIGSAGF
ncbi:Nucleotide sugar dehydrogenase [Penicillium robsamsonii]|uniref:Nucleotide sugar dehydrogenase n=1 Tax=Penicillium robsamsonii TaxID=1792511 RepID=UPI00254781A8|nr:Nucleotide sugar dehydrogenase [Penicillium robsamsonii]KAJ5810780.1 Nucleotide sugar dehydrogenase [Penicillium robsamsonii]